jgi:hypothetical protein
VRNTRRISIASPRTRYGMMYRVTRIDLPFLGKPDHVVIAGELAGDPPF